MSAFEDIWAVAVWYRSRDIDPHTVEYAWRTYQYHDIGEVLKSYAVGND